MPKFYFEVTHAGEKHPATELDLPSRAAAWEECTRTSGQILWELNEKLEVGTEWRMVVSSGSKRPLLSLRIVAESHD